VVLRIRKEGSEVLRKKARAVAAVDNSIRRLVDDMFETMYHADGVGLAAPQVGRSLRIVVVDVGDGPIALINPKVTSASGSVTDIEGCLSIPGVSGKVPRAERITVEALDADGRQVLFQADGLLARAVQHEVDHLDGILFVDRATEIVRTSDDQQ
jgi:peptide deformylase